MNGTLFSQGGDAELTIDSGHKFNTRSTLVVPSILLIAGLSTLYDNGLIYSSYDVYDGIQKRLPDFHTRLDDYTVYIPVVAAYGLNLAGIKGKNNFLDRSIILAISNVAATATYRVIKRNTLILRPDSSDYFSFPSGHTTLAFVSATFLYEEFKDISPWYGVAGYTVATATGVMRMLNNQHWMSDIFAGAALGIMVTELSYYVYPIVKDFVSTKILSNKINSLSFLPYYSRAHTGFYLSLGLNL